ncbi:MAG: hypothetical protein JWQ71_2219 [Pedosphaera sp.]|nr:hypothetical protein [Pedosphaera sp.]
MTDRCPILNDREFWTRLEFATSGWLKNSDNPALRRFWIDGFIPEAATNTKRGLDVAGVVWLGKGSRMQYQYRFLASAPQKLLHGHRHDFEIENLSLDEGRQLLEIVITDQKMP